MNLKFMRLAGFKSFMNPTTIPFTPQVTAIVGPNGCGKSNVVEAIRWVLGESSARALRATRGVDVIFSGSDHHKPMGQCSVELVFDNSMGSIGEGLASYTEISLRRQMRSDGVSTYYLNGRAARRRDIQKVFLGTGLGARSYALIEQGLAAQLITSGPEVLLEQIEEAAGVSTYRENRRQTQNSIARTRANLAEVSHLVAEIEARVRQLKSQTRAVQRAQKLQERQTVLRQQLVAVRWQDLQQVSAARQQELEAAEEALNKARAEHLAAQAQREKLQATVQAARTEFDRAQQNKVQLASALEVAQERLDRQQQRVGEIATRCEALQQALEQATVEREQRLQEQTESTERLKANEAELQQVGEHLARVQQVQPEDDLEQRYEQLNEQVKGLHLRSQLSDQRIQNTQVRQNDLQRRIEQITSSAPDEAAIAQQQEQLGQLQQQFEQLTAVLPSTEQALAEAIEVRNQARPAVAALERELTECETSLNVLREQLQQLRAREGLSESAGTAARWSLDNNLERIELDVQEGWLVAVERVLGSLIDAYQVPDVSWLDSVAEQVDSGSLDLVSVEGEGGNPADFPADSLASVLNSAPEPLLRMLAKVGRVEENGDIQDVLSRFETAVTRDGHLYGKGWVQLGGDLEVSGIAERVATIAVLEQRLGGCTTELTSAREQLHSSEQGVAGLSEQLQQDNLKCRELEGELLQARTLLESHQNAGARVRDELASLGEQLTQANTELQQYSSEKDKCSAQLLQVEPDLQQLQQQRAEHHRKRRESDQQLHNLYQQQRQLAVESEGLNGRLQYAQQRLEQLATQVETQQQTLNVESENKASAEVGMDDLRQKMQGLLDQASAGESEFSAAQAKFSEQNSVLDTSQQRVAQCLRVEQEFDDKFAQARINVATAERDMSHAREALDGVDPETLLADIPEDSSAQEWEESLKKIADKIQRLGALNYAAAEEMEAEGERLAEFQGQYEEIEKAIDELLKADAEIETEARQQFDRAFNQINQEFSKKFQKLFDGGEAQLNLQDDGVRIEATPPGKTSRALTLLSGGEKSLVAIALVLAIFELNPAPLCVMDEVDAALDDVNSLNFSKLIAEMSEQVQFLLITHNKVVMEMSQVLHGVTMREPGVSRVVGIDLQQAEEWLASQEVAQ